MPKITLEATTTIQRPLSDVWAYMSDLATIPQWDPEVVEVEWKPPLHVGDTFTITSVLIGRRASAVARITEYEPNSVIGWEIDEQRRWLKLVHRLRARVSYSMESADATTTRLSRDETAEVEGLFLRLAWPLIAWRGKADRAEEILGVKRILEAGLERTA